jgi:hypothetical protein
VRKPHPTVTVGAKISPDMADKLYQLAANEFGGNVSEALRKAIKLLISQPSK